MNLFIFPQLISSLECEAPLGYPGIPEGFSLKQSLIVLRHGYRSPFDAYINFTGGDIWKCAEDDALYPRLHGGPNGRSFRTKYDPRVMIYKPSCNKAELTIEGMEMHKKLGEFYHEQYVTKLNFLPNDYKPSFISLRSSEPDRCMRSAMSFLHGFYPPASSNPITKNIFTGTSVHESLQPQILGHCKDIDKIWNEFIQSEQYISKKEKASQFLKPIIESSGYKWDDVQWFYVGDWIYTLQCSGKVTPPGMSQETIDSAIDALRYFTIDFFQFKRGVTGSQIVRELYRAIDSGLSGEDSTKLHIMGAHDVTIVAILNFFGVNVDEIPAFRSHLALEILEKNQNVYLRLVLNGKQIKEPILYSDVKAETAKYLHYCVEEYP